ncbi:MAG: hypothetical protein ACRETW_01130, partial [Stenotrophobium sp.]
EASEYGLTPAPFLQPPDPEGHKGAFDAWKKAGVPVFAFTIQGSTHFEWSLIPTLPTTSWCPQIVNGECSGGWGNAMAQYYTLAWFDRWLKKPGEAGYTDADARLLDDAGPQGAAKMSFYARSARSYPARDGTMRTCEDIRAGCTDSAVSTGGTSGGGAMPLNLLLILLTASVLRMLIAVRSSVRIRD